MQPVVCSSLLQDAGRPYCEMMLSTLLQ